MNQYVRRGWRSMLGAVTVGAIVFGLSLQGAPAGDNTGLASVSGVESAGRTPSATATSVPDATVQKHLPQWGVAGQGTDFDGIEMGPGDRHIRQARIISSSPVGSGGGSAARGGGLALGDPCDCDQDCDPAAGDQCNLVQCVRRSTCTGNPSVLCQVDEDCAGVGICNPALANLVKRCDTVQLIDWPCEFAPDNGFCNLDLCKDDGTGTEHSVCATADDRGDGTGSPLNACAKQCNGGPNVGQNCDNGGDCPGLDTGGNVAACVLRTGGACDEATDSCYVGTPGDFSTAIGRCCETGVAEPACLGEKTLADCTTAGGAWYRYRSPLEVLGDGVCECPKYGSGVTPNGTDEGSVGLVRPSPLVCLTGTDIERAAGRAPVYCEDADGNGVSENFCLKRCVGGDNANKTCQADVDCAIIGACNPGGQTCVVPNGGSDCPTEGATCEGVDPGTCQNDPCGANVEGGCTDGFLNIGDDYTLPNGSYLRLTQFRFRGGVSNQGEQIIFEFWTADGASLVDSFAFTPDRTGTRDWDIEVDCWPNCNAPLGEVAQPAPIIIPPTGIVKMRSNRTIAVILFNVETPFVPDGAAAFWSQTTAPADVGGNNPNLSMQDNVLGDYPGTDVYIFELLGEKVPPPLGACCDDGLTCTDTLRWECGLCSDPPAGNSYASPCTIDDDCQYGTCNTHSGTCQVLCADTVEDCPQGGLTGSSCQFNRWFGPISHTDFVFGGSDLQLCDGIHPCDRGACCQSDGSCDVLTDADCTTANGTFLGIATDCSPNCCPQASTGSDCACETKVCQDNTGGTPVLTDQLCVTDSDCGSQPEFTCVVACTPNPPTLLHHPYSCYDVFPSEIEPQVACDPGNGDADCTGLQIACTTSADCPGFEACLSGFCDATGWTCRQSFTIAYSVTKTDHIPDPEGIFGVNQGEGCSLNTNTDNVGWYELFKLVDPTPGTCDGDGTTECSTDADCDDVGGPCTGDDTTDDCFDLTVATCCTDPVLLGWPFVSRFLTCPCVRAEHVEGIAPDFNDANQLKSGDGPNSLANIPCEDGNRSFSVKLAPGNYGYQIRAGRNCLGASVPCDTDDDCPGTACVLPNQDYVLHLSVQSCDKAACCLGDSCIVTNELDCVRQGGSYLGNIPDNPITNCTGNPCVLGSCCVDGNCLDDAQHNELAECTGDGGLFIGGITDCNLQPCPACPFDNPQSCQQSQTIFGDIPLSDRNTDNGAGGAEVGVSQLTADDIIFNGSDVDNICWRVGMYDNDIASCEQGPGFDNTWEIRVYEPDATGAIPGDEICSSTIQVLNKIEGTGQATGTWYYSGTMDPPCNLTGTPGVSKYYVEISGFGDTGCSVRNTWSRDHGNGHSAWQSIEDQSGTAVRLGYQLSQIYNLDIGFCSEGGITTPDPVLGVCCRCIFPNNCVDGVTNTECQDVYLGVFVAADVCTNDPCPGIPVNDDCADAIPVAGVPPTPGFLDIDCENICATDDGPPTSNGFNGFCGGSHSNNGEMHDDVWYSYTAEQCGRLQITSCGLADNDQMIAIYDGIGVADCPLVTGDELACNDDGCTGSGQAGPSKVEVDLSPGQAIRVRVGGWNNEVPGGYIGDPRGFMTLRWSFITTCAPVVPPTLAPPPHDILKNRYISVAPQNGSLPHHLRLTLTSTLVNGAPTGGEYWANQPDPVTCVSQVTTTKPVDAPTWSSCPTVHLSGCPIIPTSTYDIHAVSEDDEVSTGSLVVNTQALPGGNKWWGDCVGAFDPNADEWTGPDGLVSINDAVAAIKTYQNPSLVGPGCGTPPCNATHVSVTDVHPAGFPTHDYGTPNQVVDINDVFAIILGFQGKEFPGPQLGNCP